MKFNEDTIRDAKKHAVECFPYESCGIVSSGRYIQCNNIHEDPLNHFLINDNEIAKYHINGTIEGIIHSHNNHPHLSVDDYHSQIRNNVPYGIVNLVYGNVTSFFAWGSGYDIDELEGREFIHGLNDCYGLVRDYYHVKMGIELNNYPRDYEWWLKGEDVILNNLKNSGFKIIDNVPLKEGDVVLLSINSKTANHTGILNDNGTFLHHLSGRPSRRDPLDAWRSHIYGFARYIG